MTEMNTPVKQLGYHLSRNVLSTITPPIPTAYHWATTYSPTLTRPLLDMSQGVPRVPPPISLQSALGKAASSPQSFGYVRWDGEPALRAALVEEMKSVYGRNGQGVDVNADDVALTAGCNLAFVASVMCVAQAGDEVILPVPWYFNHEMTLNLLGITPIPLPTLPQDGFSPSVEKCKELITPRTRAIVLVTPNNPTGAIYPPSLLASFHALAQSHNLPLIIDETYRDFLDPTSGAPHTLFVPSSASESSWRSTLIHLFSFSKAYALPGHRLGAIISSPALLQECRKVLDTLQICAPRPIQLALAPLLPSLRGFVNETAESVRARHVIFRENLPKKWKIGAQGGYFAFVRHPFPRVRGEVVSKRLAQERGVVSLPGEFFRPAAAQVADGEGGVDAGQGWKQDSTPVSEEHRWIRFSVANVDDESVRRVCERLGSVTGSLGGMLRGRLGL
ncbi:pyridoxal phosphate-dependent transferase [Cyathus striatus]|nr:pyridoxal phosphate-dependent transferase [Cyathus striatus]